MANFWLIQRGSFRKSGNGLTGSNGIVRLDYMGAAEFEYGAIPKAFRRLMYHFSKYKIFGTGIYTPENDELMMFCKEDEQQAVVQVIRQFVEKPYGLKEYSELDMVPKARKNETLLYNSCFTDFWWCIDIRKQCSDWMAFLKPQTELFKAAIECDCQEWWLKKSPEEREEEYKTSLHW